MRVLIINGPGMRALGKREPKIYGDKSLEDMKVSLERDANEYGVELDFFESSYEGAVIDRLYEDDYDALMINPAAYSHYSLAIYDALRAVEKYKVEVHVTNVFKRNEQRHNMLTAGACDAVICGCGIYGYNLALRQVMNVLVTFNRKYN